MNSSDQNPKIPLWTFFATDVALLLVAWFIADRSARPLSTDAMMGIVACVITGALVALVPWVIRIERQKNEALDERQRALEALAQTVSSSSEQISIAAGGLHELAELFHKNLRQAEQLPHRLQEKIAEFQAQLANVDAAEKEELEKEVAALRASEADQLESVCDKIARATADLTKLEAATRQHLAATGEALNKLALGTANAIGKAQAAAEQALGQARVEAAKHMGESAGHNIRALDVAKVAAVTDLEAKLSAAATAATERIARDLQTRISALIAALDEKLAQGNSAGVAPAPAAVSTPVLPPVSAPVSENDHPAPPAPAAAMNGGLATAAHPVPDAPPAKRVRKPRREEPVPAATAAAPEPPPVAIDKIPEVMPVAPATSEPFGTRISPAPAAPATDGDGDATPVVASGTATPRIENPAPAAVAVSDPPKPAATKKRAPKSASAAATEPDLGLGIDEGLPRAGVIERVLSSDGATRLLVTAYIGIGNRLFIRGEGPGLTWEKGVPLQFVSIGKWRWETNDASNPVRFKLLKNDEQECSALGAQTLDPGHQQEVTATF